MRASRAASLAALTALAGASLGMAQPMATDDADLCWLARGAETAGEDDDLQLCREDVWFHAPATKVGNTAEHTGYVRWDSTPPAGSVASGAGGGTLTSSALHQFGDPFDERESFVAKGTLTGTLDTLGVELYLFPPAGMAQNETTYRVDALLEIGGKTFTTIGDLTVPMETAGSAVRRIRFGWRDILTKMENRGMDPAAEHEIRLVVHGTGIATSAAVFVYDTTEVPAGMLVNVDPSSLDATWKLQKA